MIMLLWDSGGGSLCAFLSPTLVALVISLPSAWSVWEAWQLDGKPCSSFQPHLQLPWYSPLKFYNFPF